MRIVLDKFGGRATIGASGQIQVYGEGVLPLHAELLAEPRDGVSPVVLRALGGEMWVTRRRLRRLLTPDARWVLADGDSFVIGPHTFIYNNLNNFDQDHDVDEDVRRAVSWLTR